MKNLSSKRFATYAALFLAYITVWADIIFALPQPAPFSILWFIGSFLKNVARIAFIIYIVDRTLPFDVEKWRKAISRMPSRHEIQRALKVMVLSVAAALIGIVVFWLIDVSNPLFESYGHERVAVLVPFIVLSSISVGYAEELFFRFFFIDGLVEAGATRPIAALSSLLIFAISHAAQGISGIAFAALLAVFYTSLRNRGYGIHELALGHAMYDAIVLLFVLA